MYNVHACINLYTGFVLYNHSKLTLDWICLWSIHLLPWLTKQLLETLRYTYSWKLLVTGQTSYIFHSRSRFYNCFHRQYICIYTYQTNKYMCICIYRLCYLRIVCRVFVVIQVKHCIGLSFRYTQTYPTQLFPLLLHSQIYFYTYIYVYGYSIYLHLARVGNSERVIRLLVSSRICLSAAANIGIQSTRYLLRSRDLFEFLQVQIYVYICIYMFKL